MCVYVGKLLVLLDQGEDAAKVYKRLIDRNQENASYYFGMEQATKPGGSLQRWLTYI